MNKHDVFPGEMSIGVTYAHSGLRRFSAGDTGNVLMVDRLIRHPNSKTRPAWPDSRVSAIDRP